MIPSDQTSLPTIGIYGLGIMGTGVAACFVMHGYRVVAWDSNPSKRQTFPLAIERLCHVASDLAAPSVVAEIADSELDIAAVADYVVECVSEDVDTKVSLLRNIRAASGNRVVVMTSTSALSISELGAKAACGETIVGTHFWNPAHLMPLVEVTPGSNTSPEAVAAVQSLLRAVGKTVVVLRRDAPGFIGNRLLHAMWREAIEIVQTEIASVDDVDLVARLTFGLRMPAIGPFENMDLVGLDLIEQIQVRLLPSLADGHRPPPLLQDLVRKGDVGMKSGRGFYDWRMRSSAEVIERRDQHIIRELSLLSERGSTESV